MLLGLGHPVGRQFELPQERQRLPVARPEGDQTLHHRPGGGHFAEVEQHDAQRPENVRVIGLLGAEPFEHLPRLRQELPAERQVSGEAKPELEVVGLEFDRPAVVRVRLPPPPAGQFEGEAPPEVGQGVVGAEAEDRPGEVGRLGQVVGVEVGAGEGFQHRDRVRVVVPDPCQHPGAGSAQVAAEQVQDGRFEADPVG